MRAAQSRGPAAPASILLLAPVLAGAVAAGGGDPMPEPIRYTLRFPAPQTHYAEVEAVIPTGGRDGVELMMAVWTPGSYLVREFARNLEGLGARGESGAELAVVKSDKNRWWVAAAGEERIVVSYRLYCREMTVRTNFVDSEFALLNGAATFLTLADGRRGPYEIRLQPPPGWSASVTPLPPLAGGGPHAYRARDLDHLIDSPLYAGNPAIYEFTVGGVPHRLVNEGEGAVWDGAASAAGAEAVAREHQALWGGVPYPRYTFFNIITEARGGLEHAESSVLMTSRWACRTRKGFLDWLGLVSHELFHAWNGKRLRPVELGPFDYEQEIFTRGLWVVEGVTAYYDDLLVHRAGLSHREEYLESLSDTIERLQTTPGRLVLPLEQASFDAWIKQYRRDENSSNSSVSYYVKGAVVAWLLDVEVRRATGGRRSLDDVMRRAYERFSGPRGFAHGDFQAVAEEVSGTDLDAFFRRALEGTEELDYTPALEWLGLRFTAGEREDEKPEEEAGWLGVAVEERKGRLRVAGVPRCTPGWGAGINVDDELVALDGYRVTADDWRERLAAYRPGEEARLLVARRQRLIELAVTFGAEPELAWRLEPHPEASAEQRSRLDDWLGSSRGSGGG